MTKELAVAVALLAHDPVRPTRLREGNGEARGIT